MGRITENRGWEEGEEEENAPGDMQEGIAVKITNM